MQPKISDSGPILLAGMSFYGDPFDMHSGWDEDNHIGRLWKRFTDYLSENPKWMLSGRLPNGWPKAMYEVHIYSAETHLKGLFEVFVGVECAPQEVGDVPIELCVKPLPAGSYAVFTFSGRDIVVDWEQDIQAWLAASGYRSAHAFNFQYYDERFKGLDRLEESVLDVYVPITDA